MIFKKKKDIILNIDQIEMDLKVGINKLDNGAKIKKQTKHYNREDRYSYYIEGTNGTVTVDRNYEADTIRQDIDDALREIFEDADFRPGSDLLLGRVHDAIQSIEGIINYNLLHPSADIEADESQILTYGRVYDNNTGAVVMDDGVGNLYVETRLPWYTINANTFTIRIKRGGTTIVEFTDDGEGTLVDASGTEISTSFLDYKTGVLNINFLGTTTVLESDEIWVDYRYAFYAEFQYGDLDLLEELYDSTSI